MAERIIDVFKRSSKKASRIETVNEELQKFLSIYRITPNVNASSGMAPAELRFARKICLVFDRLRPREKKMDGRKNTNGKHYNPGEKIYFKNYEFGKTMWEKGTIAKRIGKMLYLIKHPKWVIKRHLNQIKKKYTADVDQCKEELMMVIYDMFDVSMPQPVQQNQSSK